MKNNENKGGNASSGDRPTLLPLEQLDRKNGSYENMFFDNLVWLTTEEARIYLRLPSKEALRQLIYRGVLNRPCKLGRSYRFKKSELDMHIESSRLHKRRS